MSGMIKRSIASVCVLTLIFVFAVSAFAADYTHTNYTIVTTANGEGADKKLGSNQKEYTDVLLSCSINAAMADVSLWEDNLFGDKYYGNDQTFRVGSGNRAWWYGGQEASYHVSMRVAGNMGNTVTASGTFRNIQSKSAGIWDRIK